MQNGSAADMSGHFLRGLVERRLTPLLALALLLIAGATPPAFAQSTWSPVVITPPKVDSIDENHVSLFSGKAQFTIPAVTLGDVSYTPYSYNGEHFQQGGLIDHNYGYIVQCASTFGTNYTGSQLCTTYSGGVQAIYGEERASFNYVNGVYQPQAGDGSTFVDNTSTCTWTKRDGTVIVFAAYHASGVPYCLSNNILSIRHPNGRISTYYYYGTFSTTALTLSPILSIATNSGYMLKYIYSGTPSFGAQTSVVAFNRAFETCDPTAVSCTLVNTGWPTANLIWQNKTVSPCDNFPSLGSGYNSCQHYIFTIQDAANRSHVFELDSYFRVITYQPPEATSPVFYYTLCSLLVGGTMTNCFGYPQYPWHPTIFEPQPLMWDLVASVTRNGKVWTYGAYFTPGNPPAYSSWQHSVGNPLGKGMVANGNSTPGTESSFGPTDNLAIYDGTYFQFENSVRNVLSSKKLPSGIKYVYTFENYRANLTQIQENGVSGSGLSTTQTATYPQPGVSTCTNIVTCNEPVTVTDANGNTSTFTYDPTHGGVLTVTGPAVNGVQPQTRYTYAQRNAWYLSSANVMTSDPNAIWVLMTESHCISGAAAAPPALPGSGCTLPNDEVLTTYDYGPTTSGPNNLILRGKAVSWNGQTLRTCYGHDNQGNKIWETSPNASPSSCPAY